LEDWLTALRDNGWTAFDRKARQPRLAGLLVSLGAKKVAYRTTRAKASRTARPNTLSAIYGLGEFPLHTDEADQERPPHYVILGSAVPRLAPTLVLSLRAGPIVLANEERALFRVAGRLRCHYARFREDRGTEQVIRYNVVTHTPLNQAAAEIDATLASCTPLAQRIDWLQSRIAVIDNWTCLHGRERIDEAEGTKMHRLHVWTHI
jgi:hypothetical protein